MKQTFWVQSECSMYNEWFHSWMSQSENQEGKEVAGKRHGSSPNSWEQPAPLIWSKKFCACLHAHLMIWIFQPSLPVHLALLALARVAFMGKSCLKKHQWVWSCTTLKIGWGMDLGVTVCFWHLNVYAMNVFHRQLLPASRTLLLWLDRPLDATLAKQMTTNGGCLFLHGVHTYGAFQSIVFLFFLYWWRWG